MDTMLSKALREFTTGPLNQLLVNIAGKEGQLWEEAFKRFLRRENPWKASDPRFRLINTFDLVVPADYDHATRLASFHKEYGSEFYFFNSDITDANFSGATTKLVPGQKLKVKVFQITRTVTSEDCMTFLRSQNAVLTGAQGASLVYEQAKDQLPVGKWSVSFDKKDALWQDSVGYRRVSHVYRLSGGDWHFHLCPFGLDWYDAFCLLCFRDFESA